MADRTEPETTQGPATKETAEVARVFISYASADKAAADSICSGLERGGIACWIAPRDVTPGVFYADAIVEAINSSRILIVVLSVNSVGSQHVLREVERASAKRRPLVAFRLDTTPLPTGLEYFLSASHWLDASGGTIERALPELVTAVRRLLVLPATPGGDVTPPADGVGGATAICKSTPTPSRKRLRVVTVAVVLLLAVLVGKVWLSNRSALQYATAPVVTVTPAINRAAPTISDKSIAVLPFTDMSEKHDQEYFADGMAEETLNQLAKIPALKVIGRTSSFQFKGKGEDLRQIGATLGAAYVLEGSVRRSGDRVRVTTQLIQTSDGTHLWSETYDRTAADALMVEDEIAHGLARALQLEVVTRPQVPPRSLEAYDSYLRGLHAREGYNQAGFEEAVANFRQALQFDPNYVPAAEELARTLADQAEWGFVPPRVGFERARAAATSALELEAKSALVHAVLGSIHTWYDWNWSDAERELNTAVALAPNDPAILLFAAEFPSAIGRWDDAARLLSESLALDPLVASAHEESGWAYMRSGRLPEAESAFRRMLEISPTYVGGHHDLGTVLLLEKQPEAALKEMQLETPQGGRDAGLANVYQALHRGRDADTALVKLESEHSGDLAMWIAEVYAFRGQKNLALTWLDRAYAQKDIYLWLIRGDPLFKNLEGDPRYGAFLRKMNLPE